MEMSITIGNLNDIYTATFEARNKWRNILLSLGVKNDTIKSIGTEWRNNPDDCYREGLSKWLEDGERSLGDLVKALSSPTVGHRDIAMAVKRNSYFIFRDFSTESKTGNFIISYQ